jgi:F-type H+-transporting ATPase subunit gamma
METLEDIARRLANARDLGAIVSTMKAMAAVSIRQYERAVEALVDYNRTTELGLLVLLQQRTAVGELLDQRLGPKTGIIVFGTDQGMVGQFNEQIATTAVEQIAQLKLEPAQRPLLIVGRRVSSRLEDAGYLPNHIFDVPGSTAAINPAVQDLIGWIEQWRNQAKVERVLLFYNKLLSGAAYRPQRVQLWPIDLIQFEHLEGAAWPNHVLPLFTLEWNALFSALLRQYLFVTLFRAFAESLASENAARLVSMQVAERNVEERVAELQKQYHHQRQNAITSELLDIISGFELLADEDS